MHKLLKRRCLWNRKELEETEFLYSPFTKIYETLNVNSDIEVISLSCDDLTGEEKTEFKSIWTLHIFYKQPVYKQPPFEWQIAKNFGGLSHLSLGNIKN